MVGEIATGNGLHGVQASLTGHLVFSRCTRPMLRRQLRALGSLPTIWSTHVIGSCATVIRTLCPHCKSLASQSIRLSGKNGNPALEYPDNVYKQWCPSVVTRLHAPHRLDRDAVMTDAMRALVGQEGD